MKNADVTTRGPTFFEVILGLEMTSTKKPITLPRSWVRLKKDYGYVLVDIPKSSAEFLRIRNDFVTQNGPDTVEMVLKVQSPVVYRQYQELKQTLTARKRHHKPVTEDTLYAGCSRQDLENTCQSGFTKSQQKDTPLGRGCLFLRSAGFAAHKHCPRCKSGHRFLFRCRVLTGPCVLGYRDLKPADTGPRTAVDNKSNPRTYVTLNCDQAYPEYLIVFK